MSYNPQPGQGPLVINVTVTGFVPLPSPAPSDPTKAIYPNGFFTQATFAVAPGSQSSWVTIDTTTNRATGRPTMHLGKGASGDGLKDLGDGMILHFSLSSGYVPLDISFVQYEPQNASNDDPDGLLTFPQSSVSIPPALPLTGEGPETLEVYNLWGAGTPGRPKPKRNGRDYKWRMFLLIKRTSDGAIGVIDPDFQNDD
ncbi:MAG: hypothetical protein RLZZ15_786 [Verrucomicrobiota bacterium]|jgi:hypothetical protein